MRGGIRWLLLGFDKNRNGLPRSQISGPVWLENLGLSLGPKWALGMDIVGLGLGPNKKKVATKRK